MRLFVNKGISQQDMCQNRNPQISWPTIAGQQVSTVGYMMSGI